MTNLPTLENWFITESDMLVGEIHNHPKFRDGETVVTSRVAELDLKNNRAVTKNTNYILGRRLGEQNAKIQND